MSAAAVEFVGDNVQWPEEVIPVIATVSEAAAVVVRDAGITVALLPSGMVVVLAAVNTPVIRARFLFPDPT